MENVDKPLVTVITPSYNHARYIEQAIESVAQQTYPNIEHIIIDDGSSDDSHELLTSLKKSKYPNLILKLHKKNKGHIRINEAVDIAKGDYISILSSDDWYLPEKIEKQIVLFQRLSDKYGVVYSGGYRYFEDSKTYLEPKTNKMMQRGNILRELLTKPFFIYPISPLIKKKCLTDYPFLPNLRAEGEAIYLRIAMKYYFDFIAEPLVVMRDHSKNTGKDTYGMLNDNIIVREILFSHPDFPRSLLTYKKLILGRIHLAKGWELIRKHKDSKNGRKQLLKAIRYKPNLLFSNPRAFIGLILSYL